MVGLVGNVVQRSGGQKNTQVGPDLPGTARQCETTDAAGKPGGGQQNMNALRRSQQRDRRRTGRHTDGPVAIPAEGFAGGGPKIMVGLDYKDRLVAAPGNRSVLDR